MNNQQEEESQFSVRQLVPGQLSYRQLAQLPVRPVRPIRKGRRYFGAGNRQLIMSAVLLVLAFLFAAIFIQGLIIPLIHQMIPAKHMDAHPLQLSPQDLRTASRIDQLLANEVAQQQFSGSVLIAKNGQVLLSKGYSMADWDDQVPNTPHIKFYLGSTTKQFTAMAILLLQERDKLHVHDSLCSYIPHCPAAWQPLTIHEVLTHTSGIPQLNISDSSYTSLQAWIDSFDDVPLSFTPGSQYSYCSICYQILGYVVEQASGEPYSTFLQQAIFDPLHMRNTGFDTHYASLPDHAIGYASWQVKDISITWDVASQWSFLFGSGLLYSTVEDLYRWDQALYTHTLVSQQTMDQAFTSYATSEFAGSGYGYGWFIAEAPVPEHRLIWHYGAIAGFRTYIGRYIDDRITIIVLSNLSKVDEMALANSLEQFVFGRV